MVKNHLTINTAKTQVITFGSWSQLKKIAADIPSSLRIGQTNLKQINEVKKSEGGDGHQPIMAEPHKRSSSRMNSALIQLARIEHLISRSDLRHAIQALALDHLHCTLVWSTAGTSATAPIRRFFRMAERLACSQFKGLRLMCREKMKVLRNPETRKPDHAEKIELLCQLLSAVKPEGLSNKTADKDKQ